MLNTKKLLAHILLAFIGEKEVKEGVTVFRLGKLRILRLDSPSQWCATLVSKDRPSGKPANTFSKVYNGSSYVDCNISVDTDGKVQILSLFGGAISGAQYGYVINKYVTYFV